MQNNNQKEIAPQHGDFVVWRLMKQKQQIHDERITRAYNMRARMRLTKH